MALTTEKHERPKAQEAWGLCPMCAGSKFHVMVFDANNHMADYNTWLMCDQCDYEVPVALMDMAPIFD